MPLPLTRNTAGPRRRNYFTLLIALILLALCVPALYQSPASAATTFTVNALYDNPDNDTADGVCNDGVGNCTLRAAIQQAHAAAGADTINFSITGTINLAAALPNLSSDISISGPGANLLTVRRNTGGDYRVFTVNSGATVTISGLTVSNGKTPNGAAGNFGGDAQGGGGLANFGTLALTGVTLTGNSTGAGGAGVNIGGRGGPGGAVYNAGTLTMTSCVLSNNTPGAGGTGNNGGGWGGDGGAVFSVNTLAMTDCVLSNNTAGAPAAGSGGSGGSGGAIYSRNSLLTLTRITVTNNRAGSAAPGSSSFGGNGGGTGGGMYLQGGTVTITDSTVSNNASGQSGDGAYNYAGGFENSATTTVTGSTIIGNTGLAAGAILNRQTLNMVNTTINGNRGFGGGSVTNSDSSATLKLTNCTVTANDNFGVVAYAAPFVRNTIIAGNNGGSGPDTSGNFNSQGHNFIGNGDASTGFNAAGDLVGTTATPIDPKLGVLADNGGPTLTHALLAGSPALDAGDNSLAKDFNNVALTTDQRGVGRFGGAGHVVDIGAYEFHPSLEDVADKGTNEDTPLSLSFDVGDGAVSVTSVTAASNNQALVPDAGLSVSGSGSVRTLQITPAANQSGVADITLTVNYTGGGSANDSFQLTVTPVNDAPTFTKGANQTVAEDAGPQTVSGWATAISPGPDESSQAVSFQVTTNSNAALFSTAPAVSASGTLTYTPAPNANGSATVTLVAKDDGGTANGGQDTSAAQTFTITVTPVNDAPAAQDQSVSTPEDSSRFISFAATDPENDTLTFSVVSGPSHGTLTGTGSGRTYTPAANYNGPDSFTFKATDSAGAESQTATVSITVTAVNDPPVNTVPGSQATNQNTALVFSAANSNAVTVSDVDAGADPLRVTLTATNGLLTLGGTTGLTFTAGDGTDDATMTFAGTVSDLNAALAGLAFKPNAGFSGPASLQITTNDQGSTGSGGARSDTDFVQITVRPGTIEFKQSSYTAAEGGAALAVVVRRTGDTSQAASVAYATDDGSIPSVSVPCSATTGAALDRCDFTKALGRLSFAPGETEKTVSVLVGDDSYFEGPETAVIRLSGVSGTGVVLGSRTVATLEITDDAQEPPGNPIDETGRFVRQHYHDFLNREPDAEGLAFWTGEIEQCGADSQCREVKRINVSAAFFLSIEFQQTGYLVYRLDKVAFGNISVARPVPLALAEFLSDTQGIGLGVVVGAAGWEQKLEENKRSFVDAFVLRSRFLSRYPNSTTPELYVDSLNANAGGALSQEERDGLVNDLKGGAKTRAQVLRAVAEHAAVARRESNQAFVLMQYFGYLRRNPDDAPERNRDFSGFNFWLGKLNEFNGDYIAAEMVKAFLSADEYRKRFGQ